MADEKNEFEHDIFISYSRKDNNSEWITEFRQYVLDSISDRQDLGELDVFIDYEDLAGNLNVKEGLYQHLEGSKAIYIMLTNNYINSDWCKQEIDWFADLRDENSKCIENIFVIRMEPTDIPALDTLKQLNGYLFYDHKSDEKLKTAYGWPDGIHKDNPDYQSYQEEMRKLCSNTYDFLVCNQQQQKTSTAAAVEKKSIFLSYVNYVNDSDKWCQFRDQLIEANFEVTNDQPPSLSDWANSAEFENWLQSQASKSMLYIQFASSNDAFDLPNKGSLFDSQDVIITAEAELFVFKGLKVTTLLLHDEQEVQQLPEFAKKLTPEEIVTGDFEKLCIHISDPEQANTKGIRFCIEYVNDNAVVADDLMDIIAMHFGPSCNIDTITNFDIPKSKTSFPNSTETNPDKQENSLAQKLVEADITVLLKADRSNKQLFTARKELSECLMSSAQKNLAKGAVIARPNSGEAPGRFGPFKTFNWVGCDLDVLKEEDSDQIQRLKDYVDN